MSERRIKVITDKGKDDPNLPILSERLTKTGDAIHKRADTLKEEKILLFQLIQSFGKTLEMLNWNEGGDKDGYSAESMAATFMLWLIKHQESLNIAGAEYKEIIPYTRAYIHALTNDSTFADEVQKIVEESSFL